MGLRQDLERNREVLSGLKGVNEPEIGHEIARAFGESVVASGNGRPDASDTNAWLDLLVTTGDAERGWRRFFGPGDGRCADCHAFQERGADVGPDLTLVSNRLDRRRLLESILQPSREVAPRYVATIIETVDGRAFSGLSLGADSDGKTEQFLGADGKKFVLDIDQIEHRSLSSQSIMPADLDKVLSVDDLRDLLAFFDRGGS
jgi:putative heme-binding domain-containing protein